MKQETNKEIDLLLRRLSRRDGEAVRDAETQIDERHLDADELSSYAQNALPAAARARYTTHLAECSTCRRLATELSLALGVTTAAAPVETLTASSGVKKFLSSLFSPMVLRYAVPALGVLVVMVVGFVVLRQRDARESFVAQIDVRTSPAPVAIPPSASPAPLADQAPGGPEQRTANASPDKDTSPPRETAPQRAGQVEAPAGTADSAGTGPAPAPLATPSEVAPLVELRPGVASPSSATPAPKSVASFQSEEAKKTADSRKDTDAKKETEAKRQPEAVVQVQSSDVGEGGKQKQQANEPTRTGSIAKDGVDQNRTQPAAPMGGAATGARAMTRRRAEDSREEAETRSVAGRKFRKDRGIWTDTAYDSSTRTVNMARSSEQFRALVADEPAIGTIAEQLDGEVIVVWKGRAYRIR